ncbi:MAG: hypothetical protein JWQ38_3071 [Flavipsychrobacter sp.]|nr:hypothetical protein [Flavipsychrobacter sp.]
MIHSKKHFLALLTAGLLAGTGAFAQPNKERRHYDSIAAKYSAANAVYTNYNKQLVIKQDGGTLTAESHITMEKLLISDLSPRISNKDDFSYSDFNTLADYSANARIPSGQGYKTVRCNNFGEGGSGDDIFYDDFREVEVYYTGLQKNSVTETKYSLEHTDVHLLPPLFMQENIPIAKATCQVVVPKFVNMKFVLQNTGNITIVQTKEEKNDNIIYTFTASDVPAIKSYSNVPSVWLYTAPHIIPYIASYRLTGASKDSSVLANTDDLYRHVYRYVRNMNMRTDTGLTNLVARLTENDKTQKEKAAHIYNWVQKNIHYIAFEKGLEGFIPRPADSVYKRKYGDCKDMSSILEAMCRKAGLDAHFAWIGTRHKPYTYGETPLPMASNHMICALKLDNEWVFMDGTHPTLPFGRNRDDIQGKETMIAIDAANYKIVTIPVETADMSMTADTTIMSINDLAVAGKVKVAYKGYNAWDLNMNMMYHKGQDREKQIKALTQRGSNKYIMTRYDLDMDNSGNRNALVNADFNIDDYVHKAGKECIVNMNLKRDFEDSRINEQDRKVPYFYDFKQKKNEVVVLNIPAGYKVTYLPKDAKGSVDGLWNYKISYKATKNTITLTKQFELNTLEVSKQQFAANNKLVDDLKNNYKESVVLTATN